MRIPGLGRLMRIQGESMSPLLHDGQLVLVKDGVYLYRTPQKGEMVAARPASLGGKAVIKRVIGLPHEVVHIGSKEWCLAEEDFFIVGDQADDSLDSRSFGPVRRDELVGSVWFWPWERIDKNFAKRNFPGDLAGSHSDGDASPSQRSAPTKEL